MIDFLIGIIAFIFVLYLVINIVKGLLGKKNTPSCNGNCMRCHLCNKEDTDINLNHSRKNTGRKNSSK